MRKLLPTWLGALGRRTVARASADVAPVPTPVHNFLMDLITIAPAVGGGAYAFPGADGTCRGWVQFILHSSLQIEIHRLWTLRPGEGNGTMMIGKVCELADRHGVEIRLRPHSFGRKPHRLSSAQLQAWYERYGFSGTRKRMLRKPQTKS